MDKSFEIVTHGKCVLCGNDIVDVDNIFFCKDCCKKQKARRSRLIIVDREFADEHCYGCPCFRHDAFDDTMYCTRKKVKIRCEVLDGSRDVHPSK